jgi:hypothetical protein
MSQWKNTDNTANAVLWATVPYGQAPNTTNRDAMFGNTTANGYGTHQTIGMYGVDGTEIALGSKQITAAAPNTGGTGGSYVPGETLTIDNTGATASKNASLIILTTEVRALVVNAAGSGYANGDTIRLATGAGSNSGVFTVTTGAANTGVASLALTARGSFTTNPTASQGATANITGSGTGLTVDASMRILTMGVADPGKYTVAPTTTANNTLSGSAAGTGALASLTVTSGVGKGEVAHTGWIVRKVGTGGRAGRVETEVLVAGGMSSDGSDDAIFPDS